MAIRYYFSDECQGRQAMAKIHNLGYWAILIKSGLPQGAKIGIECSPLAEGVIEKEFKDYII